MNHLRAGSWRAVGRAPGSRQLENDNDPVLAFMLAQQAASRLQFEARALETTAATSRDRELVRSEVQIAIGQIEALRSRIAPFQHGTRDEVRFEAQEILAALDGTREHFERIGQSAGPPVARNAMEVAARLLRRRH